MGSLLRDGGGGGTGSKTLSYAAISKKEPLSNNTQINNVRKVIINIIPRKSSENYFLKLQLFKINNTVTLII